MKQILSLLISLSVITLSGCSNINSNQKAAQLDARECTAVQRDLSKPFSRDSYWCDPSVARHYQEPLLVVGGRVESPVEE